ncbi:unnamed protein product, partial [Musa textilis]
IVDHIINPSSSFHVEDMNEEEPYVLKESCPWTPSIATILLWLSNLTSESSLPHYTWQAKRGHQTMTSHPVKEMITALESIKQPWLMGSLTFFFVCHHVFQVGLPPLVYPFASVARVLLRFIALLLQVKCPFTLA